MKVVTIGRNPDNNDIVINDAKVSRSHLQIIQDDHGNYSVVDLGSTNGTFVNGTRITDEMVLQPGDQVLIGSTVLPWQSYFEGAPVPPTPPSPVKEDPPKPYRTWLYILIGAVALLIIASVVGWCFYNHKEKENVKQEQLKEQEKKEAEEVKRKEAEEARLEAVKASEEFEKAMRKAAQSKSDEDRVYAEEMKMKADEAQKLAQQKEEAWKTMQTERDKAVEAREKAEEQSNKDKAAKDQAVRDKEIAQKAEKQARAEKEAAEKLAKLTKDFYNVVYMASDRQLKEVCNTLKINNIPLEEQRKRILIIERFNGYSTNEERQNLIILINRAINGQSLNESPVLESPTNNPISE